MNRAEYIDYLRRIPHLKLPPHYLCEVLEAISRGQPSRTRVQSEVMELFPEKEIKSVFRGMVQPATVRLGFARSQPDCFCLAPNGKLVVSFEKEHNVPIRVCIADYATLELGLFAQAFSVLDAALRKDDPSSYERSKRFGQYLESFCVSLPAAPRSPVAEQIRFLYGDGGHALFAHPDRRKDLIAEALPANKLVQMDDARWRILEHLKSCSVLASSYFVDAVLWEEARSGDSRVELWEGAVPAPTRLNRRGRSFEGLIQR